MPFRRLLTTALCAFAALSPNLKAQPVPPADARKLEASLVANPDDRVARAKLLVYYSGPSRTMPIEQVRQARRRHLLWMIEHHPEQPELGYPIGAIDPKGHVLADPEAFAEADKLWRQHASAPDASAKILVNACYFFRIADRAFATRLVTQGMERYRKDEALATMKGTLDALSLLGVTGVNQYGSVAAFDEKLMESEPARQARKELETITNPFVLGGAAALLSSNHNAHVFHDMGKEWHDGTLRLAQTCYERARQLDPDNIRWSSGLLRTYKSAASAARSTAEKVVHLEKAAKFPGTPQDRLSLLEALANAHFDAGKLTDAAAEAEELLALGTERKGKPDGDAIFHANIVLGRLALRKEEVAKAKEHLLAAGRTPGSPVLNSFGPKMTLAEELLARGERDTVQEYLNLCGVFWKSPAGRLEAWSATVQSGGFPDFNSHTIVPANLIGAAAPPFRLRDLSGKERTLEEFKGKVVLLDFWATWCAPCVTEMPLLETLSKELREKDVVVLGIDVREEKDMVSEFIVKGKYTFPILLTTDDDVTDRYKVTAYPTLVVVNPAGRIADYIIGSKSDERLRSAVAKGRGSASR